MKIIIDEIIIIINQNKSQKNHQSLILLNQEELCVFAPVAVGVEGGTRFQFGLTVAECKEAEVKAFVKKNNEIIGNIFFIYMFKTKYTS
jgi:hypothetical protein